MNSPIRLLGLLLSATAFSLAGCETPTPPEPVVVDEWEDPALTVEEIQDAVAELQQFLPIKIHDELRLVRMTCDYNGSVTFWYCTSDKLTDQLRKFGAKKFNERMRKIVEKVDLESDDMPEQLAEILRQDHISLQYVFENRYETYLGSFSLNGSAIGGEERVGREQTNPFAVQNVSLTGNE